MGGSTSKVTHEAVAKSQFLLTNRSLCRAVLMRAIARRSLYSLILEVVYHHLCFILLVTQTNPTIVEEYQTNDEVDHGETTHNFPPQFARYRNLITVNGRFSQTPFLELCVNLYVARNLFFFSLREWG